MAQAMPVARLQPDLLREGVTAQKQAALAPHPVQTIQANVRAALVLGTRDGVGQVASCGAAMSLLGEMSLYDTQSVR